jgi:hypothetical protein
MQQACMYHPPQYTFSHVGLVLDVAIQVGVFRVVAPCSDVIGYKHFGGPWCLLLQEYSSRSLVTNEMCHK